MKGRTKITLSLLALAAVALLAAPWILRTWWTLRSSNPVRRGAELAGRLGCFSCHGALGRGGIPDPGPTEDTVPGWSGGVWMMYVNSDEDVRAIIRDGSAHDNHERTDGDEHGHPAGGEHELRLQMPAYGDVIDAGELDDLTAAFKVLAGMSLPARGTAERDGYDLAREWSCFSCHGPGGSGGLPNPGSFTGFVPGWYGPDFRELVRSREEFDEWIRTGGLERLDRQVVAGWFRRRQRIPMPPYDRLGDEQLDRLWAYVRWLDETGGGFQGVRNSW